MIARAVTLAGALVLAACGASDERTLTVSATASLTDAMAAIAEAFEAAHPGVTVSLNVASTSALVTQLESGASADVLATADMTSQERLAAAGLVGAAHVFARNELAIAVKPGNPRGVAVPTDLAALDVVALCAEAVPCGRYAAAMLSAAGVALPESRITRAEDARAALGAVSRGDADAAVVYVTDVRAAGALVTGVAVPAALNVRADYGVSVVAATSHRDLARVFVDFVRSDAAAALLREAGFLAP